MNLEGAAENKQRLLHYRIRFEERNDSEKNVESHHEITKKTMMLPYLYFEEN
ncbi:hypothetical protein [Paenibacillus sp. FSL R7-0272]|uniref:hypothetical protein n=1 Tax=Paenibacillus sp. FSL R7-0272 TaxID=2921679 RepID=UPI0030DD3D64